ncbi:unnamed protein product [Victoria cruziana]
MAMASSHHSPLNIPLATNRICTQRRARFFPRRASMKNLNQQPTTGEDEAKKDDRLVKLAIATFAAGILTLAPISDAMAAKTGGRIGGQAFRSAPRASSPRINNSRTNIYINPPVAPPLVGGYGFGSPFYGGWGWSPFSFFVPGPSVAVGIGGGFEFFALFVLLGVISAIVRRFTGGRNDEDDDYY